MSFVYSLVRGVSAVCLIKPPLAQLSFIVTFLSLFLLFLSASLCFFYLPPFPLVPLHTLPLRPSPLRQSRFPQTHVTAHPSSFLPPYDPPYAASSPPSLPSSPSSASWFDLFSAPPPRLPVHELDSWTDGGPGMLAPSRPLPVKCRYFSSSFWFRSSKCFSFRP